MQSSPCLCFFFSPKTFTSSFDHSFIPNSGYKHQVPLCSSLHKLFGGEKATHREKQALCAVGGILFYFLPAALPSSAASAQVQTHCHGEPVLRAFHAFVIMQKEMSGRVFLPNKQNPFSAVSNNDANDLYLTGGSSRNRLNVRLRSLWKECCFSKVPFLVCGKVPASFSRCPHLVPLKGF